MGTLKPNFLVGIGSSAGGLVANKALLDALPPDTDMAFVIVAHLMPNANSQLVEILSRHTKMKVLLATQAMSIWPNHVYVIPPNADLTVESYAFNIVTPRIRRNNQVDLLLTSLAVAMEANAIGIILSGYDGDGTEGCKQIKAKGGTTFAQDNSAEVNHMPVNARDSGFVDHVLPPNKISDELTKIGKHFNK